MTSFEITLKLITVKQLKLVIYVMETDSSACYFQNSLGSVWFDVESVRIAVWRFSVICTVGQDYQCSIQIYKNIILTLVVLAVCVKSLSSWKIKLHSNSTPDPTKFCSGILMSFPFINLSSCSDKLHGLLKMLTLCGHWNVFKYFFCHTHFILDEGKKSWST